MREESLVKMTFRWYGEKDPVTLPYIRQIPGMTGIVSAIYDVPVGEVWPRERIAALKAQIEAEGLSFEVVESVPVHEDIKLGAPGADRLIENYSENIRRLGEAGVKVVCYNFMPVFDWLRTELNYEWSDGAHALSYDHETMLELDPGKGELSLPGWDESYTKDQLQELLNAYASVDEEKLWSHLKVFLDKVIPVAKSAGVKMAIHPDDPPWGIFGLPRIITNEENLNRFLRLHDDPYNGLTFCTGSLGASAANDLPTMIRRFGGEGRIHFAHIRNIKRDGEKNFVESAHPTAYGSLNMYEIMKALYESGFDGYIRPDHGRMIWGETGRYGYGLYDRALGSTYIHGLWEAIATERKSHHEIAN